MRCAQRLLLAFVLLTACVFAPIQSQPIAVLSQTASRAPQTAVVKNPASYYEERRRAIELVRAENWSRAEPILEDLVAVYADDGDIWHMLGLAYMQNAKWTEAVAALKQAVELGAFLSGVPTGSSPTNDIMIKIAESYSQLGDKDRAEEWLQRSLAARYDGRPFLANNEQLANAFPPQEYQKLIGVWSDPDLSRDAAWVADLNYLANEIQRLHANFDDIYSVAELNAKISGIEQKIPTLSDQEIVFALLELIGSLDNGHNILIPTNGAKGSLPRLPVQFYWFSDGLYIVNAREGFEHLIGNQVTHIADRSFIEVLDSAKSLNARNNEMQHLWLAPYFIAMPDVLHGLGITNSPDEVAISVVSQDGTRQKVTLSGIDWQFVGLPKLPHLQTETQPKYLARHNENYWFEFVAEDLLFLQFNTVQDSRDERLADFSDRLVNAINTRDVQNLVVDLRHNPGGNGSILRSLVKAIIYFEAARPDGKLFVITGRGTYSAGQDFLTSIDRFTDVIIVGEPSGSRPNRFGEAGWFRLPYSGLSGIISTQYHQSSSAEDARIWIAPHIPVFMTADEYFNGQDPALNAILTVIGK